MTLAVLGPCSFTLKTNLQSVTYAWEAAFAAHEVIGASPVYEDMGEGESTVSIEGVIHPRAIGVDGGFSALATARAQRIPLPFLLRDLRPVGWFLISSLQRSDTVLDPTGIGMKIDFSADLLRCGTPGAGLVPSIMRLL